MSGGRTVRVLGGDGHSLCCAQVRAYLSFFFFFCMYELSGAGAPVVDGDMVLKLEPSCVSRLGIAVASVFLASSSGFVSSTTTALSSASFVLTKRRKVPGSCLHFGDLRV